jgi:hypothetical protein
VSGFYLVPKLGLGTPLLAKLSLATIFVPKYNLGTREKEALMGRNVILAGTGFHNRASIIRRYCHDGLKAVLKREPDNPHDPNAIAVFIEVPRLFGFLGRGLQQIGYIKASAAIGLAKRMDEGLSIQARVASVYAPSDRDYPRVSLELDYGSPPSTQARKRRTQKDSV